MTGAELPQVVRVSAPGKVNLFLGVGDVQPDGYHDLATVFQALSLTEEMTATHADDISMSMHADVDVSDVPLDDRNLAIRAAKLLQQHTGTTMGVHLVVNKGVPVAGGMGGGSADAAAALVACDALWGTSLPHAELHDLASQLGADVPFSLMGGTALGTGRGDKLSPMLTQGRLHWVLVTQPEGLSTPAIYRKLDEMRGSGVGYRPEVSAELFRALRAGDAERVAAELHNDLQAAALAERPDLAAIIELGEAEGALKGMITGSGPTVVLLCADMPQAIHVQTAMLIAGHTAYRAHGPVSGARVVSSA